MSNTELHKYQMYIDGQWVEAQTKDHFETANPYTGKPWALIPRGGEADVDHAVDAAHRAFTAGDWPKLNPTSRVTWGTC